MEFALDLGQPEVDVRRLILAGDAGRKVLLAVGFEAALDREQQFFRGEVGAQQFRLFRQAHAQAPELGRLRDGLRRPRPDRLGGEDVSLLHIDQPRLAVDAFRHMPAQLAVGEFAFSVQEQFRCAEVSHWVSQPPA